MNLKTFKEIPVSKLVVISNAAGKAVVLQNEFIQHATNKNLQGVTYTWQRYQEKEYIVFSKSFNTLDKAAYAFCIAPFGLTDLLVETRYFESSGSGAMANRAKGFGGVILNILAGFWSSKGRTFRNEIDLLKKMRQTVTGGGAQVLSGQSHLESQAILKSLQLALQEALKQILSSAFQGQIPPLSSTQTISQNVQQSDIAHTLSSMHSPSWSDVPQQSSAPRSAPSLDDLEKLEW